MTSQTFDILIIGGGIMGSSIAYHLANDGFKGRIAVFEKDPTYEFSSTTLSAGGVRQQFSTAVNIRISTYSIDFYETFDETMAVGGERANSEFRQCGYLFLANKKNWPLIENHYHFQKSMGAAVELLSIEEALQIVPNLNPEGLVGASFGRKDGYLDPYGTLQGFVRKARSLGVKYLYEEVTGILKEGSRVTGVITRKEDRYPGAVVVNAAGPWAAEVGRMASVNLPVDPVRRMVFVFQPSEIFSYDLPLVIDVSGLYFRHETGKVIMTGMSILEEPPGFNFKVDNSFFTQKMWPILADRVSVFDRLRLIKGWAGLYEVNRWDSNAILGEHPELHGFFMAVGFSGHGFQQAPAVGKALSELIRLGRYETVDVSSLGFGRILKGEKVLEEEVV